MLARTLGPKYSFYPCYVQPKLDGVRALAQIQPNGAVVFQSRDEKLWLYPVVKHLCDQIASLSSVLGPLILDGELYVHGWRLQRINGAVAVKRNGPCKDSSLVQFHVFDVVRPDQKFSERWLAIANTIRQANLDHIRLVDTNYVHSELQMQQYFHSATSQGYEGVMLRPDGPYEFGETPHGTQKRSKFLWKYKQWEDGEFECVGVTQGEGKADIGIGALVLNTHDCAATFKVGTGFTDEERIEYMQNPPIGRLIRVRYLFLTDAGIPFNPSFLAVMS